MYVPYVCPSTWRTEQQDQHFAISFSGLDGNAELAEFWAHPQEIPLAQRPVLNPANPPLLPPGWAVCSPRQLATNCRLARELACPIYYCAVAHQSREAWFAPPARHGARASYSPSAVGEGQGAWRALHGWDITVPQLQNSSTRNSRTHLYVLFPRNHADPLRDGSSESARKMVKSATLPGL